VPDFIDFSDVQPPTLSRWDRGDGAAAIHGLVKALDDAGLPDQLQASLRLLDRAEELAAAARAKQNAAREQLGAADAALLADGPSAIDAYAAAVTSSKPWLDNSNPVQAADAMGGVMNAVHRLKANAVQTALASAHGIHQRLQGVCAEVVADIASVPALPAAVWSATNSGHAAEVAIRGGHELAWASLVKAGVRFDRVHAASALLRETGQFTAELNFPDGCPTRVGVMFLAWREAFEGLEQVRRLPGPLRVRAACDRGFRPGLYLASDHARAAAERPARRGLLAMLGR
jgi:hypothetical protein